MLLNITHHDENGKLGGFDSLSTAPTNRICKARSLDKNSICAKCYSKSLTSFRKSLRENLLKNMDILAGRDLTDNEVNETKFSTLYARIESFGDVANVTQARNYQRIISANPQTNFGVWTKNWAFWCIVFDRLGKPNNMTFVVSSPYENVPFDVNCMPEKWRGYVDHVFTCYDPSKFPMVKESRCCGVSCRDCLKCYKKNTAFYINEATRTRARKNIAEREALNDAFKNM